MKRIVQIAFLVACAAWATGCATPYARHRARDAADIVTATVGLGVGAKARVSFLNLGLLFQQDQFGLRGGELIDPRYDSEQMVDLQLVICGMEGFTGGTGRHKDFDYLHFFWLPVGSIPVIYESPNYPSAAYYTQLEVVAGLGPSVRLGFNPGELLDFILGWWKIDIYHDDL